VGGAFSEMSTVAANGFARWDGESWASLGAGPGTEVYMLHASADGLYVSSKGSLGTDSTASLIARWNGLNWSTLGRGTGLGANYVVSAVAVAGSDVYVAGYFSQVGGIRANNIARWDGKQWLSLGVGPENGDNSLVTSLAEPASMWVAFSARSAMVWCPAT